MKTIIRTLSIALVSTAILTGCSGGGPNLSCFLDCGADASLSSLSVSDATLDPAFSSSVTSYAATVPYSTDSVDVSATQSDELGLFDINGNFSSPTTVALVVGDNTITIGVLARDGSTAHDYTIVVTRASFVIDTAVGWDGAENATPFGDGAASEVFGQTFVVPADVTILQRLSFWLQHSPDDTSGEDLFFSVVVMAWNTDRATGPILYESALQSITTAHSMMSEYVVDTGGLMLMPGQEYVAFLSANNGFWDATSTLTRVGWQNADNYPDGAAWTLDSDNDSNLITSAAWDNALGTADFVVMFTF